MSVIPSSAIKLHQEYNSLQSHFTYYLTTFAVILYLLDNVPWGCMNDTPNELYWLTASLWISHFNNIVVLFQAFHEEEAVAKEASDKVMKRFAERMNKAEDASKVPGVNRIKF